ncbi:MAG: hypothetical protein ABW277_19940 [Longimicrobiaceae bacterium]
MEIEGTTTVYECQAKRGLNADARLDGAIDAFAAGLPQHPEERGILLVEPTASRPIVVDLRNGLDLVRQGVASKSPTGALRRVMRTLRARGAEDVAARLYVRMLDVEQDASDGALYAILRLEALLDDPDQAGAAWAVLVADGLRLCREGGRRTRDALVALLGQENIHLKESLSGSGRKLDRVVSGVEQLLANLGIATPPSPQPAEADRFTSKIQAAKQLLEEGSARGALDLLRSMANEIADAAVSTQVRHGNLLAAALLHLGEAAAGQDELLRVLNVAENDITALSNLAVAESMLGNADAAVGYADQVIAVDPHSVSAWVVVVQFRPDAELPGEVADEPNVLAARAFRLVAAHSWDGAISLLRRATATATAAASDDEHLLLLAQALYGRAFDAPKGQRDANELEEAGDILERVIESVQGKQDDLLLERALITRGQVARLTGDLSTAAKFFLAASLRLPASPRAAHMLASLHLDEGEPARALYAIDRIPAEQATAEIHLMRARALHALGRHDEVRGALELAVGAEPGLRGGSDMLYAVVETAIESGVVDFAEQQLARPELDQPWLTHLLRARIAVRTGDHAAATREFEAAVGAAGAGERGLVSAEFAEYLRQLGDAPRAVAVLESADAASDVELRPLYARALHDAQEITKAAALVQSVEGDSAVMPDWALQLGASVALVREDVTAAIRYLAALCARWPDLLEPALRLAHAYLQNGERARALEVLDRIRARPEVAPRQLLHLAELYIRAGAPENALPIAYEALRAEPDAEDVQLAFTSIYMRRDQEQVLEAEVIEVETGVTLRTNRGDELHYFITVEGGVGAARELAPDEPLAQDLLGKRVGEAVVLRAGALSETRAEIVEIESKYVHAFQDILLHFPERHPESTALQSFKLPENPTIEDFDFVNEAARARAESGNLLLEKYVEMGGLPLGFLAKASNSSIPVAYALIASDKARPFLVEAPGSLEASRDAAASDRPVLVTRSALIAGGHCTVLGLLRELHPHLIVPRSLIDELQEERSELVDASRRGIFGVIHGVEGPVPQGAPAEHFQEELARFDEMFDWLTRNCEVFPRPLHSIGAEDERLRVVLGASSYDFLVLTEDAGAELYADDWGLRRFLHSRTGSLGFSTYGLLLASRQAELLTQGQFEQHVAELIQLGQAGFPMTAGVLRAALVTEAFRLGSRTLPLLERLRDLSVAVDTAVRFCIDVLVETAVVPDGSRHVGAVAFALFEAVVAGRDPRRILPLIEHVARTRMKLLPEELDATLAALERCARIHVLGQRTLVTDDYLIGRQMYPDRGIV